MVADEPTELTRYVTEGTVIRHNRICELLDVRIELSPACVTYMQRADAAVAQLREQLRGQAVRRIVLIDQD